ncbi:MAG: histone deacetylase family protein [bacterium]
MKIFSTEKAGAYQTWGHPEHPDRVLKTLRWLKQTLPSDVFQEPKPAPLESIRRVHSAELVEAVSQELFLDPDTPGGSGVYAASRLSAGAAIQAAETALGGSKAFSLMRPPGHHATPDQGMGFCYFNSMAIAIEAVAGSGKARKIAVLDLDCHHGNGTEAFCRGRKPFLYVSLHQSPAYPGTGQVSFDNCLNYPLPPGTRMRDYQTVLDKALKKLTAFKPDLLGISMGFDTYEKDPLTQFGLRREDYAALGRVLNDLKIPQFALLEGGYHGDLPELVEIFMEGWAAS